MQKNMTNKDYKERKEAVIAEYEKYLEIRSENDNKSATDLNNLKEKINKIENDKFIIAVAGEAKAGKSTFINALLGVDLLPTGVLQATSAVIEIENSDSSGLRVIYAEGPGEEFKEMDVNAILVKLQEIAAVKEEFRNIPHTLLQEYI